jgi:hypothetical protein
MNRAIPWRSILLVFVCAVLAFGGTFTCTTGDDDINRPPPPSGQPK